MAKFLECCHVARKIDLAIVAGLGYRLLLATFKEQSHDQSMWKSNFGSVDGSVPAPLEDGQILAILGNGLVHLAVKR